MKKIFALLLTVVLAFSLVFMTSCSGEGATENGTTGLETLAGKTPEQLYDASVEALAMAGSFEVTTESEIIMEMNVSGIQVDVITKQWATSKINGDDSYMKSGSTSTMMYQDQIVPMGDLNPMEVWHVDGICYAISNEGKIKGELDKEKFMQDYMGKDPQESTLLNLPESWFNDIKFEAAEEGTYVLNMSVSGEEYTEYFGNVFDGLGYDFTIGDDVIYKIYFDSEGNLTKYTAEFTMSYVINGVAGTADCTSVSYVDIKDVAIEAPENADSFQTVQFQ